MAGSAVRLCDVTLREGEQAPRCAFREGDKVAIASMLADAGIDMIQLRAGSDLTVCRRLRESGVSVRVEVVCLAFHDNWKAEIDEAVGAGATVVQTVVRSADALIAQLGMDRRGVLIRVQDHISRARDAGAEGATFAPSFCFDADPSFLAELARAAVAAGATCVKLVDSMGVARPGDVAQLVSRLKDAVDVEVGVGCHDDFGLAVAGSIAGVEAGAEWVDVSVNGLGERAGHAALEQIVAALSILYDRPVEFDVARLVSVCSFVAALTREPIAPFRPIVGEHAFANQLESHVRVAVGQPELFEPFDPVLVGNRRALVLGKGSGVTAVRTKAAALGLDVGDSTVEGVVAWVNAEAERTRRPVEDSRFAEHLRTTAQPATNGQDA